MYYDDNDSYFFESERKNRPPPPGKRGEEILIRVRKADLARLFGVSKYTVESWARKDKIDIRDLRSICEVFCERRRSGKS